MDPSQIPHVFFHSRFPAAEADKKKNINGTVVVVIGRRPPIRRIRFAGKQTSLVFVLLGLGGDGSSNEITRVTEVDCFQQRAFLPKKMKRLQSRRKFAQSLGVIERWKAIDYLINRRPSFGPSAE